jgi:hypothetical protein
MVVDGSYNVPLLNVKMQFVSIYDDKMLMYASSYSPCFELSPALTI